MFSFKSEIGETVWEGCGEGLDLNKQCDRDCADLVPQFLIQLYHLASAGHELCNGDGHVGRVKEGYVAFRKMGEAGFVPNVVCWLNGLARNGDSSRVNTFLDRMEHEGFDPDVVTLINSYCRRGKMQDAFYLYKIMSVRGVMPHLVTYTALMNGLLSLNEIVDGRGSSPDILMLNILVFFKER
ncbi:hypothetical protein QQ045_032513 [Rhodiola kirilowii]